jgi:hypothetical protein
MEVKMTGEINLSTLLSSLAPQLMAREFVFCTLEHGCYADYAQLSPLASFRESEGLTLVLQRENADSAGFDYAAVFRCITLTVHSSLNAVGLTAAVSSRLAERDISANVIAAYYHDHVFVPSEQVSEALVALEELSG